MLNKMMPGSSCCVGLLNETDSQKESKLFPEVKLVLNIGELSAKMVNINTKLSITGPAGIFSVVHLGRRSSSRTRWRVGSCDEIMWRTSIK